MSRGLINKPYFYISDYIEKNKNAYYDFLSRVRTNNDMISWIKFFLEATIETARNARVKFERVVEFTNLMNREVINLPGKPDNILKIIDVLYNEPKISRKKLYELSGLKSSTYNNIVNNLIKNRIVSETTGYSRNQIIVFDKYISLFE